MLAISIQILLLKFFDMGKNILSAVEGKDSVRYSDEDLECFKVVIIGKLKKARYDLAEAKNSVMNENGTDDTAPVFKAIDEESSGTSSKTDRDNTISRLTKFISYLEAAMVRIENKTYGICQATKTLIPKERLIAVPHASMCIEMKG